MSFEFTNTSIPGLVLIKPPIFEDNRGCNIKQFERETFAKNGLPTDFYEINTSKSKKGTLRGLHFQSSYSQGKLIRFVGGAAYDVAVDLRRGSPTFGKWEAFYLTEQEPRMLYIPEHFAHGFLALEEDTFLIYCCTNQYSPTHESGIIWNDPDLSISWPLHLVGNHINLADKDSRLPCFQEIIEDLRSCL